MGGQADAITGLQAEVRRVAASQMSFKTVFSKCLFPMTLTTVVPVKLWKVLKYGAGPALLERPGTFDLVHFGSVSFPPYITDKGPLWRGRFCPLAGPKNSRSARGARGGENRRPAAGQPGTSTQGTDQRRPPGVGSSWPRSIHPGAPPRTNPQHHPRSCSREWRRK